MKRLYILLLILPTLLLSKSYLISSIPLPKTYIQNLDPYPCDEKCLQTYLENGMIFSFLSHTDSQLEDEELNMARINNLAILNVKSHTITSKLRIALLLPYKIIGKYSKSTTDSTLAYLISKKCHFELKTYKIENENESEIKDALSKISSDGFEYIIAPLTQKGLNSIVNINPQINIYFPTIHKQDSISTSPYFFYGAIDYRAQTDLLLNKAVSPLVILNDKSKIGKKLALYETEKFKENHDSGKVFKFSISKKATNLQWQFKNNKKIVGGSFFINTPLVKTGMIMSQITLYDAGATNILSTQINYNPLLLSITQYDDRKNMLIANSITNNKDSIVESSSIIGADIVYNWINYTTTVGVDYFYALATNEDREYNLALEENQVKYQIRLMRPLRYKFRLEE